MEGIHDNASPFMHLNKKKQTNNGLIELFKPSSVMQIIKPENEGTLFRE